MANVVAEAVNEASAFADEIQPSTPNAKRRHSSSFDVRLYYSAYRLADRIQALIGLTFVGISLGALSERRRFAIDRVYYDRERMYHTARYNEQGLWDWERQAVEKYFSGCSSVLVASAGGGREIIALRRMGIAARGFECHPELVAFANTLLERLGFVPDVRTAVRDECPGFPAPFAGAVVGWSGYMLIRSRQRRVAFLRSLRAQLVPGAPVLLSFMTKVSVRRLAAATRIANVARHLLGGERAEVGDYLVPNFVHFFARTEIERELTDAGFELAFFGATPYGHAVGLAR